MDLAALGIDQLERVGLHVDADHGAGHHHVVGDHGGGHLALGRAGGDGGLGVGRQRAVGRRDGEDDLTGIGGGDVSPAFTWGRFWTLAGTFMVKVSPPAPTTVRWRVARSTDLTVTLAVTVWLLPMPALMSAGRARAGAAAARAPAATVAIRALRARRDRFDFIWGSHPGFPRAGGVAP